MVRLLNFFTKGLFNKIGRIRSYFLRVLPPTSWEIETLSKAKSEFPRVLTTEETLNQIILNGASIARFGDAEFDVLDAINGNDLYQRPTAELSKRLADILRYKSIDNKLIVCIPPFNSSSNNIKNYFHRFSFWEYYWINRFNSLKKYLVNSEYGNSFVSRDTVFYENSIDRIKRIWEDRNVVFVHGDGGRFKTNSIMFDNIKRQEIVKVPSTHAYQTYDSTLKKCLEYSEDWLFILAIGPTATVLAFDLSVRGYQALDIGHLPNCYEQYLGIAPRPEALPFSSN